MGKSNGITIDVYEGEDDDVRNNVWYGHYEFPCGPGDEVDVIFKFNKFGILAVRDWRLCAAVHACRSHTWRFRSGRRLHMNRRNQTHPPPSPCSRSSPTCW